MNRHTLLLVVGSVVSACSDVDVATTINREPSALGEPSNGFPDWNERVVLVWTNRARCDPQADLASCTACAERACYSPVPPLNWDYNLNRSARFHSANLALGGCGLQHDSPCTLVATISDLYDPFAGCTNGAPSCACVAGTLSCGSVGTSWSTRISYFGTGAAAENIARGYTDPVNTFYLWLYESDSNPACGWRMSNGHRANILGGSSLLGVGFYSSTYTQDFGRGTVPTGIVSGVHYPQSGTNLAFRASWYNAAGPLTARVSIEGACYPLALERGSATNGTYLATVNPVPGGCSRYVFHFTDANGIDVFYPSTGSFTINCSGNTSDYDPTRPAPCGACTPSCDGKSCGDDLCGGSCGSCSNGLSCVNFTCSCQGTLCDSVCVDTDTSLAHCGTCNHPCNPNEVCAAGACQCQPSCAGTMCGDDGCGGQCGSCPSDRRCNAFNLCECIWGEDCGGGCVDTTRDEANCGTCGHRCRGNTKWCVDSVCVRTCAVDCTNRECGDDGCNQSSCGTCASGELCTASGQCLVAGSDAGPFDAWLPDRAGTDAALRDTATPRDAAQPDTAPTDLAGTDLARPDSAGTDSAGTDTASGPDAAVVADATGRDIAFSDRSGAGDTLGHDIPVVATDAAADAGVGRDAAQPPTVEPEGCACRTPTATSATSLAALGGLLWLGGRRRR